MEYQKLISARLVIQENSKEIDPIITAKQNEAVTVPQYRVMIYYENEKE